MFRSQTHPTVRRQRSRKQARTGYSMLEVMLASTICITAIVPALAMLRDGIALGDIIDTRHLLLTYSVSKMEEQLAIVGATWATGTLTGSFAADGQSTIRYTVTRSDAAVNGGISDKLMVVTVTAYSDDNGNGAMDSSEARTTMTTKVAKLASYVTKAGS
jgi:hypothetical protein